MKTQYSEMVDAHIYVKGGAVTRRDWHAVISAAWDQHHSAPEDSEGIEMKEQVNGDGDTLEVIKAALTRHGKGGVECSGYPFGADTWYTLTGADRQSWSRPIDQYRITAKHADRFDPDCMDFETWARAAIGRGIMPSRKTEVGTVTYSCLEDILNDESMYGEWIAIPRAEAPAAKAPAAGECHIHAINSYMQPLWDLMHNEHGLILVETEMQDIMAACKEVEQAETEAEPAAEAQGSSTLRDVAVLAANLDTSQTCDPDHHALVVAAMDALEHDRPAFDVQKACAVLRDGAQMLPLPQSAMVMTLEAALQAGIGGGKWGPRENVVGP